MKLSIEQTLLDPRISIDSAIAQKWPVRSKFVYAAPIDFANHDFLFAGRTFGNDFAIRPANETLSPKFDSVATSRSFVTNAIRRCDITTVRDRMTSLNCFPRVALGGAEFFFFARVPADRSRIKNNLGPAQGR